MIVGLWIWKWHQKQNGGLYELRRILFLRTKESGDYNMDKSKIEEIREYISKLIQQIIKEEKDFDPENLIYLEDKHLDFYDVDYERENDEVWYVFGVSNKTDKFGESISLNIIFHGDYNSWDANQYHEDFDFVEKRKIIIEKEDWVCIE